MLSLAAAALRAAVSAAGIVAARHDGQRNQCARHRHGGPGCKAEIPAADECHPGRALETRAQHAASPVRRWRFVRVVMAEAISADEVALGLNVPRALPKVRAVPVWG